MGLKTPPEVTKHPTYREEIVYVLTTKSGRTHLISESDYQELSPYVRKVELVGAYVVNEGTETELNIPMREIESVGKEKRKIEETL